MKIKEYSHKAPASPKGEENVSNTYEVYCRVKYDKIGLFGSAEKGEKETEYVLDLEKVPFVS